MQDRVDLNSDMGEGFGPWRMGDDRALLGVVSSANIACGYHAGDPGVMAATMRAALEHGVGIGAHPGLPDLQGFGRRRMAISPGEVADLVTWQLGAAQAMAKRLGGRVRHLKLHGALSNQACEDPALARAAFEAALAVDPDIVLVVLAATPMDAVARELGARRACEIFADRAYEDDATLVDRSRPGAVIHDPEQAARRILAMLEEGAIIAESGKRIVTPIDTICVHGDSPAAVEMARSLRARLEAAGVAVRPFADG